MYEMLSEKVYPLFAAQPERYAQIRGNEDNPQLKGMVLFYRFKKGTVVVADIMGLPENGSGMYGFHIHEGLSCTGNASDSFADAKGHFNPYGMEHPLHAGDLPVLMGNGGGLCWCAFFTERFMPGEVAGRTVIIHDMPDDFRSRPSGDSGSKIGCGVIR